MLISTNDSKASEARTAEVGPGEPPITGRPIARKTRQLSVKGVDEHTLQLARDAAALRGLRVSAWIRMELHEAATRTLGTIEPRNNLEMSVLREMETHLHDIKSKQIEETSKIQEIKRDLEKFEEIKKDLARIEDIKKDLDNIIKVQHGIMSRNL